MTTQAKPVVSGLSVEHDLLNPALYGKSAEYFVRHFGIHPRPPDLDFLGEILLSFSQFPYENLSKIIKHKDRMDWLEKIRLPEEVVDDHARFHLGGTCFSLTFTLETILTRFGFLCYPVMADMKWKPNSHCALIVLWQGDKYLVDPGYLLNRPLQLNVEKPRIFTSEVSGVELIFRSHESGYDLYTFNKSQMKWRYRFRDQVCSRQDFLQFWLDSYYWNSMHGLLLTRLEKDRMIYVHKHFMRETSYTEKKNRNIRQNYHEAIHEIFGIQPEIVEQALSSLDVNMARERELGLWKPKEKESA
ncbi:arylamine N-acetyltransferase [bacterium]|nr:arylamine N-acetyltransferase [bacterium]